MISSVTKCITKDKDIIKEIDKDYIMVVLDYNHNKDMKFLKKIKDKDTYFYDDALKKIDKENDKENINYTVQVNCLLESSDWAEKLFEFCNEHDNDFFVRQGFIDIVDIKKLVDNIKQSTPAEIYTTRRIRFNELFELSQTRRFVGNAFRS